VSGWGELSGLVKVRPLTLALPKPTKHGQFSASWSDTVTLLEREIGFLAPREVILEADFAEGQLRVDGLPRSTAKAASHGVVLTIVGPRDVPHDLRYPCSTFWGSGYGTRAMAGWQTNVRAIALALEALRKVDRYGVTKRGEQYAGWKALPAGSSSPSAERGRELIRQHGGVPAALKATHPDHGGDPAEFADVQAAREAGAA
jgi:hypothetical protein